jgi:hypothetical protein
MPCTASPPSSPKAKVSHNRALPSQTDTQPSESPSALGFITVTVKASALSEPETTEACDNDNDTVVDPSGVAPDDTTEKHSPSSRFPVPVLSLTTS